MPITYAQPMLSDSERTFSLHRVIFTRVALLVSGTTLLAAALFVLFAAIPVAKRIAAAQFNDAASRTDAALSSLFAPAEDLLRIGRRWLDGRAPDLASPHAFNRLFQPTLETMEHVTSVVAGTSTGQGWLLLQLPDRAWRNRMTDIPRWGARHWMIDRHADGRSVDYWNERDYDPRQRPWYQGAMQSPNDNALHWTAPYIFFTTGDPGISVSTRLKLKDGRDFVLAFDLKLRDLSQHTMYSPVGKHGLVTVITDDERVLALPAPPAERGEADWLRLVLKAAKDLALPPLNDALAAWRLAGKPSGQITSFESQDSRWLLSAHQHSLGKQLLWILTLAPESDFSPAWLKLVLVLGGASLAVLAIAILITHALAQRLARPLENLARDSERIGQLDFEPVQHARSRIVEIRQLQGSQETMRRTLQRNQATLSEQAASLRDQVSALQRAQADLRESEQRLRAFYDLGLVGVAITSPDKRWIQTNTYICRLLEYSELDLHRMSWAQVTHPDDLAADIAQFNALLAGEINGYEMEKRFVSKSGRVIPSRLVVRCVRKADASVDFIAAMIDDLTERKRAEERIHYLANFDALTGLPNRSQLDERMSYSLNVARRNQQTIALMFLDLDHFKDINDTLGHSVGDALLVELARRLRLVLRDTDIVSRLGGDEFILSMHGADERGASQVAAKLLEAIAEPYRIEGYDLNVTASIGIALYPHDGGDLETLSRNADAAMYRAKQAGRHAYRFFTAEMQACSARHLQLISALRHSVVLNQLELHYQPQISVRGGAVIGAEALLRWTHPELGAVSPAEFIPAAEDSGVIVPIGEWVIRAAVRQAKQWVARGIEPLVIAVNLSAVQFRHPDLPDLVARILDEEGLPAGHLELELTEGVAMHDPQGAIAVMNKLHASGVRMSIDDFGTGYSSLGYLKKFKVYKIKIDRSFVRDISTDAEDKAIVSAIIHMAQSLGLKTIAEGVESDGQLAFLREEGCDEVQGYYYSKPLPSEQFEAFMTARSTGDE
ncbi:EAL domain-containing protein [Accumulibacter sp.]|uniref:bifunctional diguanylate cyclase/phosphodiesterase n=1 Tax=Accumulibacter sp. TaxID=2053492 RepID=UPI002C7F0077|nr:EAL domain-containing protein [Accumulibacter sp.]HRF05571.1 EAL domain-containing protein [Accumulibacter sp.]